MLEAEEMVRRNMDAVTYQLRNNHHFWESFSPDYTQLNSPKNYLWDSIIARMLIDLYHNLKTRNRLARCAADCERRLLALNSKCFGSVLAIY